MKREMSAHEFAVTVGMDALRVATGLKPKTHSIETICRWLRHMEQYLKG